MTLTPTPPLSPAAAARSISWDASLLALALTCCGCGPAPFTAQLLSPAALPARTSADSDKPRDCPGGCLAAGAPVVTCSLSDAVVGVRVQTGGCTRSALSVFDYTADPRSASSALARGAGNHPVFTAAMTLATATRHLLPSPEPDPTGNLVHQPVAPILSAAATCDDDAHALVEVPFIVQVDGVKSVVRDDLSQVGTIEALLPLPNGQFILAGDRGAQCLETFEGGTTYFSPLKQSGVVSALVPFDSFAVVVKRVEDAVFRGDVAMVVGCSGLATLGGPGAPLQFVDAVARLGEGLVLVGRAPDGTLAVVLTDLALRNPRVQTLPQSAGSLVRSIGTASDGTLVFVYASLVDARFQKVSVDTGGVTSVSALPLIGDLDLPDRGVQIWTAPDARSFLYGWSLSVGAWSPTVSLLRARGLEDASHRWTKTLDVSSLAFAADQVVVPNSAGVVAFDAATGAQRWSYSTTQPLLAFGADRSRVQVLAGALVYSQQQLPSWMASETDAPWLGETTTLGLDGAPRLVLRGIPNGLAPTSPFTADAQGHLYAGGGSTLMRLSLPSATLEAPPTRCSRLECGSGEVDLSSDPAHCGRCQHACTGAQRCLAGACVP